MSVELIHPEGVVRVADVHHQVSVALGTRIVSLAGQVSWDVEGRLVGEGDLAAQAEQCFLNIAACLAAADAGPTDLTRFTVYVVGLDGASAEQILAGRARAEQELGVQFRQPGTYVGVSALFAPGFLIEIEATAVAS